MFDPLPTLFVTHYATVHEETELFNFYIYRAWTKSVLKFCRFLKTCVLTLNLLTTTIVAPPSNASKWQMGFNSAFMCDIPFVRVTN